MVRQNLKQSSAELLKWLETAQESAQQNLKPSLGDLIKDIVPEIKIAISQGVSKKEICHKLKEFYGLDKIPSVYQLNVALGFTKPIERKSKGSRVKVKKDLFSSGEGGKFLLKIPQG